MQFIDPADIINKEIFKKIEDDCVCSICTGITQSPIQCTKCKHNFCQACLDNWLIKHQTCPYKCGPSIKKTKNVELNELIQQFMVELGPNLSKEQEFALIIHAYMIKNNFIDPANQLTQIKIQGGPFKLSYKKDNLSY